MMETIVTEGFISFKKLEQAVFSYVCNLGRTITKIMLEAYDEELAKNRDKEQYRNKGIRQTCIKTVYGEVVYSRRVYRTETEEGKVAHIFLLDKSMQMEKIGLISTNLAEKIALTATESPYRITANIINETSGQSISHQSAWKLMQCLGERIDEEENYAVAQMNANQSKGTKYIPVLFEEMDGVWLHMQDEHHKKAKNQEMKIFTMYEGWDAEKEKENRSTLVGKTMLAGMEGSTVFHEKREACIRQKYDADIIGLRVLNGDGGSWIKEPYDLDAIFQLDRYHIYKEILRKISDRKAQRDIFKLLEEEKPDEMLEYIREYVLSMKSADETSKQSKKATELFQYLNNNRNGLLPYDKQGVAIPKPQDGIIYKHMGVQENQNCTLITMRMKHRRMRWSTNGANNMAKALYKKENKELISTIDRYTDGLIFAKPIKQVVEILSADKAPKKDGKGDSFADRISAHMPLLDAMRTASRKAFLCVFR